MILFHLSTVLGKIRVKQFLGRCNLEFPKLMAMFRILWSISDNVNKTYIFLCKYNFRDPVNKSAIEVVETPIIILQRNFSKCTIEL